MDGIKPVFDYGQGIFRLRPIFVPRRFGDAGHRLKLHPDDYYALGMNRGSMKERWLDSTFRAMNGPLTGELEGLSIIDAAEAGGDDFTLADAVKTMGADLVGDDLWSRHGGWPTYSKFFDYATPLFFHLHLDFDKARLINLSGKPEAYYFVPQLNNYLGSAPYTYYGFDPTVTKEEVRERLAMYESADNRITDLSRAFRLELGTGWYTPPGVLHAPGSVLTYEPQWNSDVNSVFENVTAEEVYDRNFLVESCPPDHTDIDFVMSLLDWDKNTDPAYREHYFRRPQTYRQGDGYCELLVVYGNEYIAATELTVDPGAEVTLKDPAPYGLIATQGHGTIGRYALETPTLIRFGGRSADEYYVSIAAAEAGVRIVNQSAVEPLVMLKHFADNHPSHTKGH